jgi:hypothetical protein
VVEADVVAPPPLAVALDGGDDAAAPTWSVARFRSTVVGEYELRVFATEVQRQWWGGMQRENLPGAPLRVTLSPAAGDPQRSTVELSGLKERPGGMIVGMAGLFLSLAWAISALVYYSIRDRQ